MKVMISAPYMHRQKKQIEKMLNGINKIEFDWVPVNERLDESDLLDIISKYDGIICGDDCLTSRVYDAAVNLKVIVKWGTGIDSLNKSEADARGIKLFNTPNAFTNPVADTTLAYILYFIRGVIDNDRVMKSGKWDKPQGYALNEKTIGIIGFGNIGRAVAKRLRPFGSRILYNDIKDIDMTGCKELSGVGSVEKDFIYSEADVITLHCDLNPTSFHILNNKTFSMFKKRPYVINTARGPLVEEEALILALEKGIIKGAALDVFEKEPLVPNHPLRRMDNVVLASHNSNSSPSCWMNIHKESINKLLFGLGFKGDVNG